MCHQQQHRQRAHRLQGSKSVRVRAVCARGARAQKRWKQSNKKGVKVMTLEVLRIVPPFFLATIKEFLCSEQNVFAALKSPVIVRSQKDINRYIA